MCTHECAIRHISIYLEKIFKKMLEEAVNLCFLIITQYERGRGKGLCPGKCFYLPVVLSLLAAMCSVT